MLEHVRRRRIDQVKVWKLDRAFRSMRECLNTLQDLEHRGVGFACLTQDIDTTEWNGLWAMLAIVAAGFGAATLLMQRREVGS